MYPTKISLFRLGHTCLTFTRSLQENTIKWVSNAKQKFAFHSSNILKSNNKEPETRFCGRGDSL